MISASHRLMVDRYANDTMTEMLEIMTVSGPWWASSLISVRSFVIRDMILPVSFLSKKLKGSFSKCPNRSLRI